ncbi:MAG: hypothetical protein Q7R83_00765 [bacterium]|nr:hypothetical protein [bacterium]
MTKAIKYDELAAFFRQEEVMAKTVPLRHLMLEEAIALYSRLETFEERMGLLQNITKAKAPSEDARLEPAGRFWAQQNRRLAFLTKIGDELEKNEGEVELRELAREIIALELLIRPNQLYAVEFSNVAVEFFANRFHTARLTLAAKKELGRFLDAEWKYWKGRMTIPPIIQALLAPATINIHALDLLVKHRVHSALPFLCSEIAGYLLQRTGEVSYIPLIHEYVTKPLTRPLLNKFHIMCRELHKQVQVVEAFEAQRDRNQEEDDRTSVFDFQMTEAERLTEVMHTALVIHGYWRIENI